MGVHVSDVFYVPINTYKTTKLSRRFYGLDRFMVLINGSINVVDGGDINTIYILGLSGFW